MAKIALKNGHRIIRIGYETPSKHPKILELEKLGMELYERPGYVPASGPGIRKLIYIGKNFIRKKLNSPTKKVLSQHPDVVIYNGTCYSIAHEMELLKFLQTNQDTRFYIIGHLNNEFDSGINHDEAQRVRMAYELSKKVFFVSQRSLNTAKKQLGISIENAEVIKNPINLSSTNMIDFPSAEGLIQMACVGNLVIKHKGQDLLFHALSKWENKDWVLNIYGNGYDMEYLVNLSRRLQLDKQIVFHGKTDDVRKIWQTNHVLAMPSIMEGMPLALVEAMICGRICIATDVGGIGEWVTDGENGFIIQAPTVPLILEGLNKAWNQKAAWKEISSKAHYTAMQRYDRNAGLTLLNKIVE